MRALLDVNVLIALLDADHTMHARATHWWAEHAPTGWASCPITQNGCLRIMAHPGYPNALPVSVVVERLREAAASAQHEFWPDDVSLLERRVADSSRIHGPRQITDIYLLALAVHRKGRFITFDGSVPREVVRGAEKHNLVVL
jgi:toxin-antitoxin system PIN domain toxin